MDWFPSSHASLPWTTPSPHTAGSPVALPVPSVTVASVEPPVELSPVPVPGSVVAGEVVVPSGPVVASPEDELPPEVLPDVMLSSPQPAVPLITAATAKIPRSRVCMKSIVPSLGGDARQAAGPVPARRRLAGAEPRAPERRICSSIRRDGGAIASSCGSTRIIGVSASVRFRPTVAAAIVGPRRLLL